LPPIFTLFPYTTLFRSLRHYQFFFEIHRRPRRLFSIAKRRIENTDHACHGEIPLIYLFPLLSSPPVREEKQRGVLALWSAASQEDRKSTRLNSSHLVIS